MVEFHDLVGVAIAPVSKKMAVKYVTLRAVGSRGGLTPVAIIIHGRRKDFFSIQTHSFFFSIQQFKRQKLVSSRSTYLSVKLW